MILILGWSRITCGESQNFDISREIGPDPLDRTGEMSKFCDSPHVMRDYPSNESIFNTSVLNKKLKTLILWRSHITCGESQNFDIS